MSGQTVYPPAGERKLITASLMIATTLVAVDMTIVNVALPQMQASLSAGADEIVWVLTSYLVATAIFMPLVGWLATRYGRSRVLFVCVAVFTIASFLCGIANSLELMVAARLVQGASGAGMVPLSQATLLDINPPERHPRAMAVFGLGTMVGPMFGPTAGGWITDTLSWRWVFFVNLPIGIVALAGLWIAGRKRRDRVERTPFDWFGFAALSLAIGSFQLMLDRGHQLGWFDSTEIIIECAVAVLALWCVVVHTLTTPQGFIKPAVFAKRNFVIGCTFSALAGFLCFSTSPIIVVMQQNLFGYSPTFTGEVGISRSVAMALSIMLVTRAVNRLGPRIPLSIGLALTAAGMAMMARLSLHADPTYMVLAGLLQGLGQGMLFVPMSIIVYDSLAPALRNEGSVFYTLTRMIGASVGISMLQVRLVDGQADVQARLAGHVRPDAPMVSWTMPDLDLAIPAEALRIYAQIMREAAMVAYNELFSFVVVGALALIPLLLAVKPSARGSARPALVAE